MICLKCHLTFGKEEITSEDENGIDLCPACGQPLYHLGLWNGKWTPEEITPEYIQSLSIPDCLKLLKWMNEYNKEVRK